MHVAFDSGKNDLALCAHFDTLRGHFGLLKFHVGSQVGHCLLHHARGLHHLRQKHLARAEQVADHAHAGHQGPFDHQQGAPKLGACFFRIDVDVGVDALDQRMRKPLLDRGGAPLLGFLFGRDRVARTDCLQRLAKLDQALGCVGSAVQQHILDQHLQLGVDLLVHFAHAGIDNAHVHARADRVKQKGGVHRLAHAIVAAEAERDIRDAAAHLGVRQVRLDPARGVDEVERVIVVLLHAGGDGEDVGIEDDVFRREPDLIDEHAIGAFADADLLVEGGSLALFIEGHHDNGSAVLQHGARIAAKLLFALLQRNGVDDALALQALQPGLDHLPLGGVHHEGDLRYFRLAAQQLQVARHRGDAVDHAFVHADVDDVGAVLHLLPRDADRLFVAAFFDQLRELRRAGDIGAFAQHDEDARLLGEGL